ncbi:MAG TPA: MauE/DoxX family redox-associated membrane protein [Candidatus Saccharimonadales bacterium]|nr:MauE/DoxX family redox-associated membrane protein [Candidatus Saccharimonadales bacterium]
MKSSSKLDARLARNLLQLGLVIVLAYAAISQLRQPDDWTTYFPDFLARHYSLVTLTKIVAVYELVLAGWILIGRYLRWAALLAALTFAGIIAFNLNQLIITFRDIGLLFMALALASLAED